MNAIDLKTARQTRVSKILGSDVNMVDLEFTIDWMETCITEGRKKDVGSGTLNGGRNMSGTETQGDACDSSASHNAQFTTTHSNCRQMIVTGFHGLNQATRDPDYFRIGAECDLWVPDSIAPVLISKWRGVKGAVRTPGAEIMASFLKRADERGYKSYFYGDSQETLSALKQNLEKRYPGHQVVGTFSPPFRSLTPEEEQEHIDMINEARPDVLWVGLGLPKQDEWIYRCKDRLNVPVAAGVGAAFGFLAETTLRAPKFFCQIGLEWAYMVVKKPKRTGKRVFGDGSEFIWKVLKEEISRLKRV